MGDQLVWFKRDLRVADHRPLREASRRGPVVGLYASEIEWLEADKHDASRLVSVNQCLVELRWLPELEPVPTPIAEPHRMPRLLQMQLGVEIGKHDPEPIVDHATADREARQRIYDRRRTEAAREEARRVYQTHGSRRSPDAREAAQRLRWRRVGREA